MVFKCPFYCNAVQSLLKAHRWHNGSKVKWIWASFRPPIFLKSFQINVLKKNYEFPQLVCHSSLTFIFSQLSLLKSLSLTFWKPQRVRKELNKNCLAWFSYEYTLVWPCRVALIQQSSTAALIIRSHMLQIPRSFHYKQFSQQSLTLDSPASGPDVAF